ncbi:MAG: hypothetical protein WC120_04405 [Parcubacteria group bacterium]
MGRHERVYREIVRFMDAVENAIAREENKKIFIRLWKIFHKKPDAFSKKIIEFLEVAESSSEESLAESKEFIADFYEWMIELLGDDYEMSVGMIYRFRLFSEADCLWQAICCNRRLISERQFTKLTVRRRDIASFSENRPNRVLEEKIRRFQKEWDQARIAHQEETRLAGTKKDVSESSPDPVEIRVKISKKRESHHSTKEELRNRIRNFIKKEIDSKINLLSRTELSNLERALSLLGSGVAGKLLNTKKHLANRAPFMEAINSGDVAMGMSILNGTGSPETVETVSQIPDELKGFSFPSGISVIIVGGSGVKKWNLLAKIVLELGARDCQFVCSDNLEKIGRISEEKLIIFLANINSHKAGSRLLKRKNNLLQIYSSNISSFGRCVAESYLAAKASGKIV